MARTMYEVKSAHSKSQPLFTGRTKRGMSTNLGFKLYWTGDQAPAAITADEELVRDVMLEHTTKASPLTPYVHQLRIGMPLPFFWAIIKTSELLKQDLYRWWHLDECTKHLLASWIVSQPEPKFLLAEKPILWEVYATMILGFEVQARITKIQSSNAYHFDPRAEAQRFTLCTWVVSVDTGCCILMRGMDQLLINFNTWELIDGGLIKLAL